MRILIVEDEVHLASALNEIMIKNGYCADAVGDGETGLDYGMSGIYDVIILDIMLPRMNGIDVLKALRREGISTPVLLLTARDEIGDKVAGLDSGADDYLTKPFSTDELLARIRAMGRRKGEYIDDSLSFCDLKLDLKAHELSSNGGGRVKLGLKEFQIMELLMQNRGIILEKERIIQKIWGYDGDAEDNNVEVYISFLRKKLSFLTAKAGIRTVRGIGYCMEELS